MEDDDARRSVEGVSTGSIDTPTGMIHKGLKLCKAVAGLVRPSQFAAASSGRVPTRQRVCPEHFSSRKVGKTKRRKGRASVEFRRHSVAAEHLLHTEEGESIEIVSQHAELVFSDDALFLDQQEEEEEEEEGNEEEEEEKEKELDAFCSSLSYPVSISEEVRSAFRGEILYANERLRTYTPRARILEVETHDPVEHNDERVGGFLAHHAPDIHSRRPSKSDAALSVRGSKKEKTAKKRHPPEKDHHPSKKDHHSSEKDHHSLEKDHHSLEKDHHPSEKYNHPSEKDHHPSEKYNHPSEKDHHSSKQFKPAPETDRHHGAKGSCGDNADRSLVHAFGGLERSLSHSAWKKTMWFVDELDGVPFSMDDNEPHASDSDADDDDAELAWAFEQDRLRDGYGMTSSSDRGHDPRIQTRWMPATDRFVPAMLDVPHAIGWYVQPRGAPSGGVCRVLDWDERCDLYLATAPLFERDVLRTVKARRSDVTEMAREDGHVYYTITRHTSLTERAPIGRVWRLLQSVPQDRRLLLLDGPYGWARIAPSRATEPSRPSTCRIPSASGERGVSSPQRVVVRQLHKGLSCRDEIEEGMLRVWQNHPHRLNSLNLDSLYADRSLPVPSVEADVYDRTPSVQPPTVTANDAASRGGREVPPVTGEGFRSHVGRWFVSVRRHAAGLDPRRKSRTVRRKENVSERSGKRKRAPKKCEADETTTPRDDSMRGPDAPRDADGGEAKDIQRTATPGGSKRPTCVPRLGLDALPVDAPQCLSPSDLRPLDMSDRIRTRSRTTRSRTTRQPMRFPTARAPERRRSAHLLTVRGSRALAAGTVYLIENLTPRSASNTLRSFPPDPTTALFRNASDPIGDRPRGPEDADREACAGSTISIAPDPSPASSPIPSPVPSPSSSSASLFLSASDGRAEGDRGPPSPKDAEGDADGRRMIPRWVPVRLVQVYIVRNPEEVYVRIRCRVYNRIAVWRVLDQARTECLVVGPLSPSVTLAK